MSRKTLLTFGAAIIVLAGGFYYFFFFAERAEDTVLSGGAPATEAEISFISLVSQLGPIEFDPQILSDDRFMSLVDMRTAVVAEPQGRTDPFGRIGR